MKTNVKFLEVIFYRTLRWQRHFDYLSSWAARKTNLIKILASRKMNFSIDILFFLYKTRLCSVLEYSSFVLMQSTKKIKCSLEVIQNNAIRTILTSFKSTSRPYLHSNSGLLPIAARRDWLHAKYLINLSNKTLNTAFNVVDSLYNSTVACKPSWLHQSSPPKG